MSEVIRVLTLLMLLLLAGALAQAGGAELSDPMRPPLGYRTSSPAESKVAAQKAGWVLQSILLGDDRSVAIIDGVALSQGERYQGARLISVKADAVVLQNRSGRRIILELTPKVDKKVSANMEKRPK